jgi:hypothetical protein
MPERRALGTLSSNIRRNKRAFIQEARFGGASGSKIAEALDRPISSIYSSTDRATLQDDYHSQPRADRPRHYTE